MTELSGIEATDGEAVLSFLLEAAQMQIVTTQSLKFAPPWDLYIFDQMASLYVVTSGRCCLKMEGFEKVYRMGCGDIALLMNNKAHHLYNDIQKYSSVKNINPRNMLIRGTFTLPEKEIASLLPEMPPVIHMKFKEMQLFPWIMRTMMMIADEPAAQESGIRANLKHLANILLIQAIRSSLRRQ
jgi:hypothetical protein